MIQCDPIIPTYITYYRYIIIIHGQLHLCRNSQKMKKIHLVEMLDLNYKIDNDVHNFIISNNLSVGYYSTHCLSFGTLFINNYSCH